MKIQKITFKKYTRFKLNKDLEEFTYTPEFKNQILLGSNGCGKTSLMKMLTPLPPDMNDLSEGGMVTVFIEHNESQYKLRSMKKGSGVYSFIMDGEELNTTHRISIQKELVLKHFGITKEIHAILTDEIQFTGLSPLERRKWFINMSDTDYDYILAVYKRIMDEFKLKNNVIKHNNKRLVAESDTLKDTYLVEAQQRLEKLNEQLDVLVEHKSPISEDQQRLTNRMDELDKLFKTNMTHYRNYKVIVTRLLLNNHISEVDLRNIKTLITEAESKLTLATAEHKRLSEKLREKQQQVAEVSISNIPPKEDLISDQQEIRMSISNLMAGRRNHITFDDPIRANDSLTNTMDYLLEITSELATYGVGVQNPDGGMEASDKIDHYRNRINDVHEKTNHISDRISAMNHLKDHDKMRCPSCQHTWYERYDEVEHKRLIAQREHITADLESLKESLTTSEDYLRGWNEYQKLLRAYHTLRTKRDELSPIWNEIAAKNLLKDNPSAIMTYVQEVSSDLKIEIEVINLRNRLKEIDRLLSVHSDIDAFSKEQREQGVIKYTKLVNDAGITKREITNRHYILKEIQHHLSLMEQTTSKLSDMYTEYLSLGSKLHEVIKQRAINTSMAEVKMDISTFENNINKAKLKKGIIRDIERELAQLNEEKDELNVLVKGLSPINGLIASSISGFIKVFISNMNTYISNIWDYPLEILMPKADVGNPVDLNYKFQLSVNNGKPVDDVSRGSTAIIEVINLAFKLSFMHKLGMKKYPLYLDEFGRSFDTTHKMKAYEYIKDIISQSMEFSNLFIISHQPDVFSVFNDCDTDYVVLDDRNVNTSMVTSTINNALEIA